MRIFFLWLIRRMCSWLLVYWHIAFLFSTSHLLALPSCWQDFAITLAEVCHWVGKTKEIANHLARILRHVTTILYLWQTGIRSVLTYS